MDSNKGSSYRQLRNNYIVSIAICIVLEEWRKEILVQPRNSHAQILQ